MTAGALVLPVNASGSTVRVPVDATARILVPAGALVSVTAARVQLTVMWMPDSETFMSLSLTTDVRDVSCATSDWDVAVVEPGSLIADANGALEWLTAFPAVARSLLCTVDVDSRQDVGAYVGALILQTPCEGVMLRVGETAASVVAPKLAAGAAKGLELLVPVGIDIVSSAADIATLDVGQFRLGRCVDAANATTTCDAALTTWLGLPQLVLRQPVAQECSMTRAPSPPADLAAYFASSSGSSLPGSLNRICAAWEAAFPPAAQGRNDAVLARLSVLETAAGGDETVVAQTWLEAFPDSRLVCLPYTVGPGKSATVSMEVFDVNFDRSQAASPPIRLAMSAVARLDRTDAPTVVLATLQLADRAPTVANLRVAPVDGQPPSAVRVNVTASQAAVETNAEAIAAALPFSLAADPAASWLAQVSVAWPTADGDETMSWHVLTRTGVDGPWYAAPSCSDATDDGAVEAVAVANGASSVVVHACAPGDFLLAGLAPGFALPAAPSNVGQGETELTARGHTRGGAGIRIVLPLVLVCVGLAVLLVVIAMRKRASTLYRTV